MKRIGLQLYTVRALLKTPEASRKTLSAVKLTGYDAVQLFGSADLIRAYAPIAHEAGLIVTSVVTDMNICEKEGDALFALCAGYQIPDICVSTSPNECLDPHAYIAKANAYAKRCREAGFTFSYHNHGHEFIRTAGGETAMSCFLKGFDPQYIDFMPDTYWIQDGGYDVRYFLEQTRGRVKTLHLKDMKRTSEGHTFAEVGNGNLYFEGIVKTALSCGVEEFVVEQDRCEGDPLESIAQSYRNVCQLLEGIV